MVIALLVFSCENNSAFGELEKFQKFFCFCAVIFFCLNCFLIGDIPIGIIGHE